MKNILIILSLILLSCNENQMDEYPPCDLPSLPYTVLYKDSLKIKGNLYFVGIIQFNRIELDSLTKFCSLFQSTIKICKIEGLSYSEFYKNLNNPNDTVALLGKRTGIHGNSFLGKIDIIKYGNKWKEQISEKDFEYYNPHNISTRIWP